MDLPVNKIDTVIYCERCKARCKIIGSRNPKAKMLRRSKESKGLCINCAVHDWLRNTYPPNILLAKSGPQVLHYTHIQKQFAEIMQIGLADAMPDEINWDLIIENWDLPFPHKMKPSASNPYTQQELDDIAAKKRPGLGEASERLSLHDLKEKMTIRSFAELNELEPGLGDDLKQCLERNQ